MSHTSAISRGRAQPVLIIGAGLAGCAAAAALARRGRRVELLADAAASASDVPVAVLAPPPVAGNDPVTALRRRGAVLTAAWCGYLEQRLGDSGRLGRGVLLLPRRERDRHRFSRLPVSGRGPVRLEAAAASDLSGARLEVACAYHPDGGWFEPAALRRALLQYAGVADIARAAVATLERRRGQWVARDRDGTQLGAAPVCVLATGMESTRLVPALQPLLIPARGQASAVRSHALRLAVSGGGYAAPATQGRLWLGATIDRGDRDTGVRPQDRKHNLTLWQRLWPATETPTVTDDFVAVRATTRDRLPLVGLIGDGLWVSAGHGTQGLASAPLAATLLAEAIAGHRLHPLLRRLGPDRPALHGRQPAARALT